MPHTDAASTYVQVPQRFQGLVALVGVILVALVIVYSAFLIENYANERRQIVLLLEHLQGLAYQQSTLEWQAVAEQNVSDEIIEKRETAISDMTKTLEELGRLEQHGLPLSSPMGLRFTQLSDLGENYQSYQDAVDKEFQFLVASEFEEAEEIDESQVDPAFEALSETLGAASINYSALAERASQFAETAQVASLVIVVMMAAWLFRRLEQGRKTAAVSAVEQRALREINVLVLHASDMIARLDANGIVQYISPAITSLLGYQPEEVIGTTFPKLLSVSEQQNFERFGKNLLRSETVKGETQSRELTFRHQDGSERSLELTWSNRLHDPEVKAIILNARDVSERKRFQEQLQHQALHDALTGLPNRTLFINRLEHALARTARSQKQFAVLFIDLDRFKLVNDSLGHESGDVLLKEVAARLRNTMRLEDTVARLGGDEFTILLEDLGHTEESVRLAERIVQVLEKPFTISGQDVYISASIGICFGGTGFENTEFSNTGQATPLELLRDADTAMYKAKKQGKARVEVFDAEIASEAAAQLRLETDLRRALERNDTEGSDTENSEFRVYYQPLVDLKTGQVVRLEALVRWEHPTLGFLPPASFIPLAEDTGLILPLGRWVLKTACQQAALWHAHATTDTPPGIAVNLSPRQFLQPHLVEEVRVILEETGLEPSQLELEITERIIMEHGETTTDTLAQLKALGVQLAIDDFGSGYSSLDYLKRFPVDTLKIDRAFIRDLASNDVDVAIVGAVTTMAQALGSQVVAEGLETAMQVSRVRALGCDTGQGYYFAKPMPYKDVEGFISGLLVAQKTS
jgi:diguanylate cyclase (GGDEF)-like protein/PAS domain S-box-containing protein